MSATMKLIDQLSLSKLTLLIIVHLSPSVLSYPFSSWSSAPASSSSLTAPPSLDESDLLALLGETSFDYLHGHYWGQRLCGHTKDHEDDNDYSRCKVPHGNGSFVDHSGRLLYSGEWKQGHMHGVGRRYFDDGRNYSGSMMWDELHGSGRMSWPNGSSFVGFFVHNRMNGMGLMSYGDGNMRKGKLLNDAWVDVCVFIEAKTGVMWKEKWVDDDYEHDVKIAKRVRNKYSDITVEIVCTAHAQTPQAVLLREANVMDNVEEERETDIHRITTKLPFSHEAFTVYTCRSVHKGQGVKEARVRNPFFVESYGECGIQFRSPTRLRRAVVNPASPFDPQQRVVNGGNAFRGQVPWQATISITDCSSSPLLSSLSLSGACDVCGATIISPYLLLTAAHCLMSGPSTVAVSLIRVKLGHTTRPASLNGAVHKVSKVYLHPQYNHRPPFFNDIALVVLEERIRINEYVNPVCLPEQRHTNLLRSVPRPTLTVSGFGLTFNASDLSRGWFYPSMLQVASIEVRNMSTCFPHSMELEHNFEGHFCAGGDLIDVHKEEDHNPLGAWRADTCFGDSGGPATLRDGLDGRHYLLGLVSSGSEVCGSSAGAVYVNVSHFLPWIRRVRLHHLVQEYKKESALPYQKLDSTLLRAIFEYLSKHDHQILRH